MVLGIFLEYFGRHGLIPYSLSSITKSRLSWSSYLAYLWQLPWGKTIHDGFEYLPSISKRRLPKSVYLVYLWQLPSGWPFVMVLGIFLDYFGRHGLMPDSLPSISKHRLSRSVYRAYLYSYHQGRPFVMVLGISLDYSGRHGLMPDI
jgi:hypothetical protein